MEMLHPSCVDPALRVLEELLDDFPVFEVDEEWQDSIRSTYWDLRFYKMFFMGLAYRQEQSSESDWHLRGSWSTMTRKFAMITEAFEIEFNRARRKTTSWESASYEMRRKIEEYKPFVKDVCILVLNGEYIKCCQFEELFLEYEEKTASLIDLILDNLGHLDSSFDLIAPAKQQFVFIDGKFKVFGKFADHISCLACLYWIGEMNHMVLKSDMESMLSDLVPKHMPYTSSVVASYLDVFKATRYQTFGAIHGLTVSYVNFLLQDLVIPSKETTDSLRNGLLFLLSLVMDKPIEESEVKILLLADINDIISEVPSLYCSHDTSLSAFLHKIDRVKIRLAELFVVKPLSSEFSSPITDIVGYMNSFLMNLDKMLKEKVAFTPPTREHIIIVYEELSSFRLFLQVKLEQQNYPEELIDDLSEFANVVYFAVYVTNLCSGSSSFAWYGSACLPNLVEDIKLAKSKVIKQIDDGLLCRNKSLTVEKEKSSSSSLLVQAATSTYEGNFIGYKQETEEIINLLVRGEKNLKIVSISGMAGQGKTTLAHKIYSDPSIHYYFHKKVQCYVSKDCKPKALLVKIACDLGCTNVDDSAEMYDLIERIWKRLKGNRYLIVLDDIWDVDIWRKVGDSFPNDVNGSRILFTSRNHDLASQAEQESICYPLRQFSHEESRELMKDKLSNCDDLPGELLDIGAKIADLCKGLPLAVALIGALLRRAGPVVDFWKKVAEMLNSYLDGEGCMDIIELSYKYLPDHLKPCFLFFGAFPRSQNIRARKLEQLWIAEGFVKENEMHLAREYLDNLVSQSLVAVSKSSSRGGIKECRVHHDLLYDLCIEKCVQDNFLQLVDESFGSGTQRYDFCHRLCINKDGPFTLANSTSKRRHLPTSQVHNLLSNTYYSGIFPQYPRELYKTWSRFLCKFRVLTVLDLECLRLLKFPGVILNNVHLRYVALNGLCIVIPQSIVGLWNLETLIVTTIRIVQIPDTLWEMECLKYVQINASRVLWQSESSMSTAATGNIEVLKGIVLSYDVKTKDFLGRFVRLKKLRCYGLSKQVINPMWFSMFGSLEKLESLHLVYHPNDFHSHEQLSPTLNFPNNLKKLSLEEGFGLHWSAMSTIGKLPNLQVLKLSQGACAGANWHLEDGEFPNLKFLELKQMNNLERIDDSGCDDTPFPCLEKLKLLWCRGLQEIPSSFGDIYTLDTIVIRLSSYKVKDIVKQIVQQQRDMGNDHLQVFGLKG